MFKFITLTILIATIGLGGALKDDVEYCVDMNIYHKHTIWRAFLSTEKYFTFPPSDETGTNVNVAKTTIETVPHLVSIGYFDGPNNKNYNHWCSGSIITETWVITAAYCLDPMIRLNTSALVIFSGSADLGNTTEGSFHTIIEEKLNWYYDGESRRYHDYQMGGIALLRVKQPILFGATRQPVELHESSEVFASGTRAAVSFWGLNEDPNARAAHPRVLNRFNVLIQPKSKCSVAYPDEDYYGKTMCTVADPANKGKKCSTEMGSSLIVSGSLAGIGSIINAPCSGSENPALYAEIPSFRKWIRTVTGAGTHWIP